MPVWCSIYSNRYVNVVKHSIFFIYLYEIFNLLNKTRIKCLFRKQFLTEFKTLNIRHINCVFITFLFWTKKLLYARFELISLIYCYVYILCRSTSMFVRQAVKRKNQRRKKVIDPAAFWSIRERPVQLPWRYQGTRPRWYRSTLSFGCYWAAGRKEVP